MFGERGHQQYGSEQVTQLEHALQTATLAVDEQAECTLIAAALLHDIGHLIEVGPAAMPPGNFDDHHEQRAYPWVLKRFGKAVGDPVRLHVLAKRYLCTRERSYIQTLSPTSQQSFLDQGGPLGAEELASFEAEEHWREAVRLRRWDDAAKDPAKKTLPIEDFSPFLEAALALATT